MLNKCQIDSDHFTIEEPEELLYNSIKQWLQNDSSELIIEKFRYLFIKGNGCDCLEARQALEDIIKSKYAKAEFNFIFNRCCHLIINEWQRHPILKAKIPLLINQIGLALPLNTAQSRTTRRLRELILKFIESEQYLKLKRLSNLIDRERENSTLNKYQTVGNLIQKYPFLHQQCLLSEDSSYEFQQTITNLQKGIQHRYELDLSRYITYRVRLVEIIRKYKADKKTRIPKRIIQPVKNPTGLSDRDLDRGLSHYIGEIANGYTYRTWALNFRDRFIYIDSHQELKQRLHDYLTFGFNCQYSKEVLSLKLSNYLDNILPDIHANRVDEFTLLRTCSQLLKVLVVDSIHNIDHYLFVDTIASMGETKVIGLLLKIVLLCDKALPYLEQRFAILFSYYESFTQDGVPWLINSLENLQLALSIHFGKVDTSLLKIL